MKHRTRCLVAGLALAAAITTLAVANIGEILTPEADTAWGAPATADDSRWDTPPTTVTPLDTAWG